MLHFKTLSEMHRANGYPPPENPMLSLLRCTQNCSMGEAAFTSDFYMIAFKKMKSGEFVYGRTRYDNDSGSMFFTKPRQTIEMRNIELEEDGFALYFHEDFLNGHVLHDEIKKYSFFEYESNEALHLSPKEEQVIWELYHKIETEYHDNPDEYSRDIILAHISSILKYSQRFYKRQFINRTELQGKTVTKFNETLAAYFKNAPQAISGLPQVKWLAGQMHMSARYLSDVLKQETGKTAMELVHIFIIAEAKHLLKGEDNTVAEIAYALGFDNPPYFSRLFKKETGISPNQFKKQLWN